MRPETLSAIFAGRDFANDDASTPSPLASDENDPPSGDANDLSRFDTPQFDTSRFDPSRFDLAGSDLRATMGYESFGRFAVNVETPSDGQRIKLILTRDKLLWWTLSAVELPVE